MRWSTLKNALTNKIVQVSYLVVIVLPIIIEISHDLKYKLHLGQLVFNVYYGGILMLVLYVLYSIFAPQQIKQHDGAKDFIAKEQPAYLDYNPDKWVNNVVAYLNDTEKDQRDAIVTLKMQLEQEENPALQKELAEQLRAKVAPLYPGCLNRMLQYQWDDIDRSKKATRLVCTVLFILACILATLSFGERIFTVISQNIKQ